MCDPGKHFRYLFSSRDRLLNSISLEHTSRYQGLSIGGKLREACRKNPVIVSKASCCRVMTSQTKITSKPLRALKSDRISLHVCAPGRGHRKLVWGCCADCEVAGDQGPSAGVVVIAAHVPLCLLPLLCSLTVLIPWYGWRKQLPLRTHLNEDGILSFSRFSVLNFPPEPSEAGSGLPGGVLAKKTSDRQFHFPGKVWEAETFDQGSGKAKVFPP